MKSPISLRTGFIILAVLSLGLLASTITVSVLFDQEKNNGKRVALQGIQRSLREMGVQDVLEPHKSEDQKDSFINNVLRTLANATGWNNKLLDQGALKARQDSPFISSQFFSLYPYEEPNVYRFNPTYIECHDTYIMRTRYVKEDLPGYDYVENGQFQVDKTVLSLKTSFQGNPYRMPHRNATGMQNPVMEDLRYIGQHKKSKRVFLNGPVVLRRFAAIRMALIEYHHDTKTLDVLHIFPSPKGKVEKNWLLHITPESQADEAPAFDILYSFNTELTCYHFDLQTHLFELKQVHPIQWPAPFDPGDTEIRGSALLSGLPGRQHLLLVHRRNKKFYYYYYATLLDRDFRPLKTLHYPVLMERPFRITFVMNMYRKQDSLAFTAGIEDRMSSVIRYNYQDFMHLFNHEQTQVQTGLPVSVSSPM